MQRAALLLLVTACSGDPLELFVEVGSPGRANTLQGLELVAAHPWTVIDPSLQDFDSITLEFAATGTTSSTVCAIEIQMGTLARTLDAELIDGDTCTAVWDGMLDGAPAPVGAVDVVASVSRVGDMAEAHSTLNILRVGIDEVQLTGEGRVGLLYRALGGVRYGYYEVDASVAPWRNRGPTGAALEPWDILTSPPLDPADPEGVERDVYNLPVGWVSGEAIDGRVSWVVEGEVDDVRLVSDSVPLADDVLVDGAMIDFEATDWVPGVGRFDVELVFHLESRSGEDWVRLPGSVRTQHRIYGLAARPEFDYEDAPHRPWVDVLDQVADWVDGTTADPDAVGAAIVEGVFYELGLQYDNERGASHYTSYPGGSYSDAAFNLSRFQEQADGNVINCSDAASIVSTYANMVGLAQRYHIIRHRTSERFELNFLHAIGRDWGASPFLSGRSAFRYHAVVGPPDTRIFDATLALDGDGDPGSAPHELLLVQGLSQTDYLVGLSPEWDEVRVFEDDQVRIR